MKIDLSHIKKNGRSHKQLVQEILLRTLLILIVLGLCFFIGLKLSEQIGENYLKSHFYFDIDPNSPQLATVIPSTRHAATLNLHRQRTDNYLEITLSSGDVYKVEFLSEDESDFILISTIGKGDEKYLYFIPDHISKKGYSKIRISPIEGNEEYWLKDIVTHTDPNFDEFPNHTIIDFDIKKSQSVLFLRYDRIGDMVITTPVFRELKLAYPDISITVLASKANQNVLLNNPYVDHIITNHKNSLFQDLPLLLKLRRQKFDACVEFDHSVVPHAILRLKIINPKKVISVKKDGRYGVNGSELSLYDFYTDKTKKIHFRDIWLATLKPFDVKPKSKEYDLFPAEKQQKQAENFIKKYSSKFLVGINLEGAVKGKKIIFSELDQICQGLYKENNNVQIINLAKVGGVWWFLFPLFISICHRLIPFFTSVVIPQYEIYRPNKLLILMLILIFLHGLLELKHHISYLWFVDINIAIISCWLSWKWFNRQICNKRILFMLHIAYIWVPISFTLFALQSILSQYGFYLLSSGPLHCVTIGFFTSMLFAMITRVSLGHSSRQVHANPFLWKLFLFIQLATLLRLIGGFNINFHYGQILFVVSALIWLFCFSGWLKEFLNIYYDDLKG